MKIALITGASRGLGRSAALKIAAMGNDVIITYHQKKTDADEVVKLIESKGRKAVALQLDVRDIKSFSQFATSVENVLREKWGTDKFDGLINNGGTGLYVPFMETTEEQFDDLMNVHLKGVYFLTQKLVPLLREGGRILNVSSGLARFSFPGSSAYAVMKGGVEVLTRYLAKELGVLGISVNTIAPGAIETDFGGGRVRDNKDMNAMISSLTALGRVGLPDDIGDVMANLLVGETKWINAQRIEASGGMLI